MILCQSDSDPGDWLLLPLAILVLLLSPIFALTVAFIYTIMDLLGESISFPADATSVPTFYVPHHQYSKLFHVSLLILLGSIFGGIHCAGWNFPFPTYTEQRLWRVASLAVTIIPIGVLLVAVLIFLVFKLLIARGICSSDADEQPLGITLAMFMLAYVFARLVLLGLALTLLRHLPPSAYVAVDWTKFYPHIL